MAASHPPAPDFSDSFLGRVTALKNESIAALGDMDFYLQLALVGVSLLLALSIATLTRRYLKRVFFKEGEHRFSYQMLDDAAKLLAPVLALVFLSFSKSFSARLGLTHWLIPACVELAMAWLVIRALRLIIQNRFIARSMGWLILLIAVLGVTGFLPDIEEYLNSLAFEVGKFKLSMLSLIKGMFLFAVLCWLASAASRGTERYLRQKAQLNYNTRELIIKLLNVLLFALVAVTTLNFIGIDLTALAVFGGALGVGIGLGLQRITANFVSGIILLMEKSIKPGDLIEISGEKGWVRQLNVRYTLIETTDGREVLHPNEELISNKVTNWTFTNTRARAEVEVRVAYDADVALVQKLMLEAAKEYKRCIPFPIPECMLTNFADDALVFRLNFWIADITEGLSMARSDVMLQILAKFRANDIRIPYPQREVRTLS